MNRQKRFILPESEIPTQWYNIQADMVNKPMPPLNPATKEPLKAEDLFPIFAEELARQELNQTDAWIDIPDEVREMYKGVLRALETVSLDGVDLGVGLFGQVDAEITARLGQVVVAVVARNGDSTDDQGY